MARLYSGALGLAAALAVGCSSLLEAGLDTGARALSTFTKAPTRGPEAAAATSPGPTPSPTPTPSPRPTPTPKPTPLRDLVFTSYSVLIDDVPYEPSSTRSLTVKNVTAATIDATRWLLDYEFKDVRGLRSSYQLLQQSFGPGEEVTILVNSIGGLHVGVYGAIGLFRKGPPECEQCRDTARMADYLQYGEPIWGSTRPSYYRLAETAVELGLWDSKDKYAPVANRSLVVKVPGATGSTNWEIRQEE